ncbi:DUF397 domain-containing protein [Actinocorallia populi]|uniref:DUF397 domain-containing protein n=1 Tax=Actinocorallia populi TaxID=2079200 RepID=UPI000D08E3A2|nr:DUF397 domain-containing protein [Actinocorallia populi]
MSTSHPSSALWRKSTYSDSDGGACVEVAGLSEVIAVRDSKNPAGPQLAFTRTAFARLTHQIRAGRHDL